MSIQNSYVLSCESPIHGFRRVGINPKTGKHYKPFFGTREKLNLTQPPPDAFKDLFGLSKAVELAQFFHDRWYAIEPMLVPCGHCFSCLKKRASNVLARAYCESLMHEHSSFVTLTFDDEHLSELPLADTNLTAPDGRPYRSLDHSVFQKFMKRLRRYNEDCDFRYVMCGEYGEKNHRPHFHAIIFGLCPDDKRPCFVRRSDPLGFNLGPSVVTSGHLTSKAITDAWKFGQVKIGTVSPNSIGYVSGYTLKSYTLGRDAEWYRVRGLLPEYQRYSRVPGLGYSWFEKHYDDVYRFGESLFDPDEFTSFILLRGSRIPASRYFFDKLALLNPAKYDKILSVKAKEGNGSEAETSHKTVGDDFRLICEMQNRRALQKHLVASHSRL